MMTDTLQRVHPLLIGCACAACAPPVGAGLPRRSFLVLGAAAGLAGAQLLAAGPARAQTRLDPDAALKQLMDGNARFMIGGKAMTSFKADLPKLREDTETKQEPFAAVLSCIDSRVPVELVFDQSIGAVFPTRVAGNVATAEGIASLEYGVAALGVPLIMVLAHQNCGAVTAAVHGKPEPGQITALYAPLQAAVSQGGGDIEKTARLNAKIQAGILANASPVFAEAIGQRKLKIVAAYYTLKSGEVTLVT
jgi:carbonic anhydrase